jgi:hypothetical protein
MKIYGEIDNRLDDVVSFDRIPAQENYLLVVHPSEIEEWLEQELPERLLDSKCRGILLVKGVPRAGLTAAEFARLQKQHGSRFHVSACAVGSVQENTRLSGDLKARFRNFFQHARGSDDKLEWSILDPQWPDNLFSAYLLAKVMSTDSEAAETVESQSPSWEAVWKSAKKEHLLLTGANLTQDTLNRSTARAVAEQIGHYLQAVAARIS